jgi:ZIP family zinc transporter
MIVPLIILATIISTALGGLFAIKFKDKLHLILGFSAGAVLGVALFDLLPESIELTENVYSVQVVAVLIATGFAIYMLIDRFFSLHHHNVDECGKPLHNGRLGAFAFVLHSFLDGFCIGLAFKVSPSIGWVVAIAVLAHDFSDGINTVGVIIKNGGGRSTALKWLTADAIAPAIGLTVAYFMTVSKSILGLILSVFVGLFLYISASDLLPESHHHHPTIWTTISTMFGMLVICAAIFFAK